MKYAFYGSLRKGEYNYNALMKGKEGVEYIQTSTLPKAQYSLYSLGAYPMVVEDPKSNSGLVIDIFDLTNDQVKSYIDRMESGAGYKMKKIIVDGMECVLWIGNSEDKGLLNWLKNSCQLVESGDWLSRK